MAIPPMLAGRDLIGQARTGTGKTAAFAVPLVERFARSGRPGVVALVLVPTRELALQVAEESNQISRGTPMRFVPVYGGVGFKPQADAMRRAEPMVVVATPGRLLDHMMQRTVPLDGVRTLILDEADRMLDMGFLPDVEKIIRSVPPQRQTALFSATVPDEIRKLCHRFLKDPISVKVEEGPQTTLLASHFRIDVERSRKTAALTALLKKETPERAIVFTRTKHFARRLARELHERGFRVVALQGNMSQNARERAMADFRSGKASILVATDVASRGIDILEVTHVVNFDMPDEPTTYVHRVGRTGRMGRSGKAFTLVSDGDSHEVHAIEHKVGITLESYDLPGIAQPGPRSRPSGTGGRQMHRHQGGGGWAAAPGSRSRDGRPVLVWDHDRR
jgi:ATP-dependent RNA helicase RhlE